MGKSGEKFMRHREEEAQREAQEQAAREAAYLTMRSSRCYPCRYEWVRYKGKPTSQRDITPNQL